ERGEAGTEEGEGCVGVGDEWRGCLIGRCRRAVVVLGIERSLSNVIHCFEALFLPWAGRLEWPGGSDDPERSTTSRSIMSLTSFEEFLSSNGIDEVECLVPDITGSARGKILPASKFEKGSKNRGLRIPEDIFILTVTGAYSWKSDATDDASVDVYMKPDLGTVRRVPWYENPTAEVICDCFYLDDRPVDISPRHVLKRVVELYAERDWQPIVAPELEFYLGKKNLDPAHPLQSPLRPA